LFWKITTHTMTTRGSREFWETTKSDPASGCGCQDRCH
jgi:hypothetical protein